MERKWVSKLEASRVCPIELKPVPLGDGIDPPAEIPERIWVNVQGREEHEAIIKDGQKCKELGVCQAFEVMQYLNRWGGWLNDEQGV